MDQDDTRDKTTLNTTKIDVRFAMLPEDLLFSDLSDGAIRLYGVLMRHADNQGMAYPSRKRLAEFCHCSVDTIDRRNRELVKAGWITIAEHFTDDQQRSNDYAVRTRQEGRTSTAPRGRESTAPRGRANAAQNESPLTRAIERDMAATPHRKRDVVFEALAEVCGIDWSRIPNAERGALNKAAAELRPLHVTPAEIEQRARHYRLHFDAAPLTPSALARHWGKCEHPPAAKQRAAPPALEFLKSQNGGRPIDVRGEIR